MTSTLALVGRPNVGKSTLFNKLTKQRKALVADSPGLTRDRRYGTAMIANAFCSVIDTGGLFGDAGAIQDAIDYQALQALSECDYVLFLVDAHEGFSVTDEEIAGRLRKLGKPIFLIVNKIDGVREDGLVAEFSGLGFASIAYISATQGHGFNALISMLGDSLPSADEVSRESKPSSIKLAVIGRPNVGKSTLINRFLGEERQVVFDSPGTTRDSIEIPFVSESGESYVFVDTAGVRRKGKVTEVAEKFSVVHALKAMKDCDVVILLIDANEGIVDQDLHILSYAVDAGCGLLIGVNKWDGLSAARKDQTKKSLARKLRFIPWVATTQISALHGTGVGHLLTTVNRIYKSGRFEVTSSDLTGRLSQIVMAHPPPSVRGREVKLRYAHKAGDHPPKIMIHGNQAQAIPSSYVRYLENSFRESLGLWGNPVVIVLKKSDNPYASKRNNLSKRQFDRRGRMIAHRKKRAKR